MTKDELDSYFTYEHLPKHLQEISKPFCKMAHQMYHQLRDCNQRDVMLQKLLEAKDAAVRTLVK